MDTTDEKQPVGASEGRTADPSGTLNTFDRQAVEAEIDALLEQTRHAPGGDARDASVMGIFQVWFQSKGICFDLPVPPAVLAAFAIAVASGDALPRKQVPTQAYFRRIMSAIDHAHQDAGLPTPTKDPAVRAVRIVIERRLFAERGVHHAPALTPDDARALSRIGIRPTLAVARQRALVLLALATNAPLAQLEAMGRRGIKATGTHLLLTLPAVGGRGISLSEREVELVCEQEETCELSCALCNLRTLDAMLPAGQRLMFRRPSTSSAARSRAALRKSATSLIAKAVLPASFEGNDQLTWEAADGDVRSSARVRLGLVADVRLLALKRDLAFILLSWHDALRNIEARRLRRDQLEEIPEGFSVDPGVRKSSQDGASDRMSITFTHDPEVCAVRALREWLSLFDAVAAGTDPRDAHVFCPIVNGYLRPQRPLSYQGVRKRLAQLSAEADLPVRLTGHSFRRGFAQTADSLHVDREDIRAAMAIGEPATLDRYLADARRGVHTDIGALFRAPGDTQ